MRSLFFMAAVALAACMTPSRQAHADAPPGPETLTDIIAGLDADVFAAFNACADPQQLERHAAFFSRDVEFYHDTGGVTWNRRAMLANTGKYACGHFTRELIPGTLEVFPIKDFGALEKGSHRFCQNGSGQCEGQAEFTILWQQTPQGWRITRVFSYGHRASE